MPYLFVFILSSIATFRLSLMFAKEIGPCRIFERIRTYFEQNSCWRKGISCILCETVWWSGLITMWLVASGFIPWQLSLIYWLATSGMAVLISEKGPKLD